MQTLSSDRWQALLLLVLISSLAHAAKGAEPPVLTASSPYDYDTTVTRVERALKGHNLDVLRDLEVAGKQGRHRHIFFCDFEQLPEAVTTDKRIGCILPCKVTVSDTGDGVRLSAMNPEAARQAAGIGLKSLCIELRNTLISVMQEATL